MVVAGKWWPPARRQGAAEEVTAPDCAGAVAAGAVQAETSVAYESRSSSRSCTRTFCGQPVETALSVPHPRDRLRRPSAMKVRSFASMAASSRYRRRASGLVILPSCNPRSIRALMRASRSLTVAERSSQRSACRRNTAPGRRPRNRSRGDLNGAVPAAAPPDASSARSCKCDQRASHGTPPCRQPASTCAGSLPSTSERIPTC